MSAHVPNSTQLAVDFECFGTVVFLGDARRAATENILLHRFRQTRSSPAQLQSIDRFIQDFRDMRWTDTGTLFVISSDSTLSATARASSEQLPSILSEVTEATSSNRRDEQGRGAPITLFTATQIVDGGNEDAQNGEAGDSDDDSVISQELQLPSIISMIRGNEDAQRIGVSPDSPRRRL